MNYYLNVSSGFFLFSLSIYHFIENSGVRAEKVTVMANFKSACYEWSGPCDVGIISNLK